VYPTPKVAHTWHFDGTLAETGTRLPLAEVLGLGATDRTSLEAAVTTRQPTVRLKAFQAPLELWYRGEGGMVMLPADGLTDELRLLGQHKIACEGAQDGFWEWDLPSGVCWMSGSFKQMLGYGEHDLPNTLVAWQSCLHPDEKDQLWADFTHHVHNDKFFDIEHRLRRADGAYAWYRFRGKTVFSESGRPLRAAGSLSDIGARKELEFHLIETTRAARAASLAKSAFLANMSHELRTPMNGVMGMLELATRQVASEQQREYLQTARSSAADLLVLLNDILDLSKIESGSFELERVPFSAWDAVDDVMSVLVPGALGTGVEVALAVRPGLPDLLLGDPVRFRQVVKNLLSNALKFTPRGRIDMRLGYADDLLRLEVADTGVGIPADRLQAIFQRFTQADTSTTRRFGGTGLGVTIVCQLARSMGGTLTAESVVGEGTTFTFTAALPTARGESARTALGQKVAVEVDASDRAHLSHILTSLGTELVPVGALDADTVLFVETGCCTELVRAHRSRGGRVIQVAQSREPTASGCGASVLRRPLRRRLVETRLLQTIEQGAGVIDHNICNRCQEPHANALSSPRQAPPPPSPPEQDAPTGAVDMSSVRILVVDDHPINQLVTRHYLEHAGATCDVVDNGAAAVQAVENGHYDLIFMDCSMPVMDGYTATAKIRRLRGIRQPFIVALTAAAMAGDRDRCIAAGMDDYISKPVSQAQVSRVVREHRLGRPNLFDQAQAISLQ